VSPTPVSELGIDFRGSPNRHSFLAAAVTTGFDFLDVGASLYDRAGEWHALCSAKSVVNSEFAHGRGVERNAYNGRSVAQVLATKKLVIGRHAGFLDFFVPIKHGDTVEAILISGPVATARPSSSDLKSRWRWIAGSAADPADARFVQYSEQSLATLTLDREQRVTFRKWLECVARLIGGEGNARETAVRATVLHSELEQARFAERMWDAARRMVDERTARSWLSTQLGDDLARIRMRELPDRAIVGLVSRSARQSDVVSEMLSLDSLQRACVELALSVGSAAGRVGTQGIVFLPRPSRAGERPRNVPAYLCERARELARRRYGLELHFGESSKASAGALNEGYSEALAAAEQALARGVPLVRAEPNATPAPSPVRALRAKLGATAADPKTLVSSFERYIDAVETQTGRRLDLCRVHLETGFDVTAQALLSPGVMDEKRYRELCDAVDRTARDATSLDELATAYRQAISNLVEFSRHPLEAAQHGSLRRALEFIHTNMAERLTLPGVARVAGFAPSHFAKLFKRAEGTSFVKYVRRARIDRAKELLQGTDLSADRVSALVGFPLRHYFHRVFREVTGMTPIEFRNSRPRSRRGRLRQATARAQSK
jgi:AraC-like DNA-binding protein